MNEITIFNDTITNAVLTELQAESEKYTGLYVDMNNAPERKYVKDKASLIAGLLKQLDRARIDKSRDYKILVEKEAGSIKDALEEANRPFSLLIDEYTEERKAILAKEKAVQDARDLLVQIDKDHDEGMLLNKMFDFEAGDRKRQQEERDNKIREEATAKATLAAQEVARMDENARIAADAKAKAEEAHRASNREHKQRVNKAARDGLQEAVLIDAETAEIIIRAIVKGQVPNVTINY